MSLRTLSFRRQRGVADLFTLTLLAAGLILGVFLVGQRTNLFPRAQTPVEPSISIPSPPSDSKKDLPSKPAEDLPKEPDKGVVCIQVITPARNTKTGECREFSTPCDVPDGWKEVSSCPTPPPISISTTPKPSVCTLGDFKDSLWAKKGESKYNPVCDANNDGKISIFDYSVLLPKF